MVIQGGSEKPDAMPPGPAFRFHPGRAPWPGEYATPFPLGDNLGDAETTMGKVASLLPAALDPEQGSQAHIKSADIFR